MRTKLHSENPHGHNRYGFAWEFVPSHGRAHLDFGCGDGAFLNSLASKHIRRLVGVDISHSAVARANEKSPRSEIFRIPNAVPLAFEDGIFSSITLLDVIEHIHEQESLLEELCRVLGDAGTLVVTVPRQHIFSFLDMGNLKFRFPALHRWWYCRNHSPREYHRRYVANPEGLIGDISAKKCWHEHFRPSRLASLLERSGFEVVLFDGTGLLSRLLGIAARVLRWPRSLRSWIHLLVQWDAKKFESMNLFCVARKVGRSCGDRGGDQADSCGARGPQAAIGPTGASRTSGETDEI